MHPTDDDGMIKVGVNEQAEARAAAAELRRRLNDDSKTASPTARARLKEELEEAEKKLR